MAAGADTGAVRVQVRGQVQGVVKGEVQGQVQVWLPVQLQGESLLLRQVRRLRSFAALYHLVDRR